MSQTTEDRILEISGPVDAMSAAVKNPPIARRE